MKTTSHLVVRVGSLLKLSSIALGREGKGRKRGWEGGRERMEGRERERERERDMKGEMCGQISTE